MIEQKNMFVAVAISIMILIGWQYFIERPKHEKQQAQIEQQQQQAAPQTGVQGPQAPTEQTAPGLGPNLDAAGLGPVHLLEVDQMTAGVDDGDRHEPSAVFRGPNGRGRDGFGVGQSDRAAVWNLWRGRKSLLPCCTRRDGQNAKEDERHRFRHGQISRGLANCITHSEIAHCPRI